MEGEPPTSDLGAIPGVSHLSVAIVLHPMLCAVVVRGCVNMAAIVVQLRPTSPASSPAQQTHFLGASYHARNLLIVSRDLTSTYACG